MALITLTSGATFKAEPSMSILDAAAKAYIVLLYSCKSGRCSTCKCKVVSGETIALHAETGLTDMEKTDGWILSCVRAANTDVVLEANDIGGIELPTVKTLPCRINQITRLAPALSGSYNFPILDDACGCDVPLSRTARHISFFDTRLGATRMFA